MIASYSYQTKQINPSTNAGSMVNRTAYVSVPDHCPMCHCGISPNYLKHNYNYDEELFSIYYECTRCRKTFLAYYDKPSDKMGEPSNYELYPKFAKEREFEKEIIELSPVFVKVYNQAIEAEEKELDELAGMGYRKALEFIIKDFCILNTQIKRRKLKKNY